MRRKFSTTETSYAVMGRLEDMFATQASAMVVYNETMFGNEGQISSSCLRAAGKSGGDRAG